jgi:hypothetical protein
MPARHRRTSTLGRSARRKLVWATADAVVNVPAGGLGNLDLLTAFEVAGSSLLGVTIMRTHLSLAVNFVGIADQTRFGLIVDRKASVGAGLGPNPSSAPEDDWMWLQNVGVTTSGAAVDTVRQIHVDSRAKRKMQELQQAYLLQLSNGNAASQNYGVFCRTLLALP